MANLKLEIKEEIILEDVQRGSVHKQTITGINNVDNRILNLPADSEITLFSFADTAGAATFVTSSFKYARITNHSTTTQVNLKVSSSTENFNVSVDTGGSFFLSTSKITGSADPNFSYDDIVDIKVESTGSTALLEYFVATT